MKNYFNLGRKFNGDSTYTTLNNSIYITDEDVNDSLIYYRFNENSGTTAYDTSGNGNNGTITGATWNNDGIDNTLTEDVDYTRSGTVFTTINSEFAWSETIVSYVFLTLGDAKQAINTSLAGLGDFADFIPIIVIALAASIIIGLILFGFAFTRRER